MDVRCVICPQTRQRASPPQHFFGYLNCRNLVRLDISDPGNRHRPLNLDVSVQQFPTVWLRRPAHPLCTLLFVPETTGWREQVLKFNIAISCSHGRGLVYSDNNLPFVQRIRTPMSTSLKMEFNGCLLSSHTTGPIHFLPLLAINMTYSNYAIFI